MAAPKRLTDKRLIGKRFYAYNTLHSAVAAAATDTKTISIAADSDFYLIKMCMFADIALAAQTDSTRVIPLCTLQLTETSSGNQMFDSAIAINNIFGYGAVPFILPEPKLFQARSTLAVDVANFSAATTYNIRLSFIGYRAYYN